MTGREQLQQILEANSGKSVWDDRAHPCCSRSLFIDADYRDRSAQHWDTTDSAQQQMPRGEKPQGIR
jgi:hypothetical protein